MDLILSSGFLAFARHLGAIEAILQAGVHVDALVGTSSGALVGALYQAGLSTDTIARLLSERPPVYFMRPHARPWQGLFSLHPLVRLLDRHLPRTFEQLSRPLALGVCDERGKHRLIHSGDLVPALLASMAIPRVFPPVSLQGIKYADGGVVDRTGTGAWRVWRPDTDAIVHVVDRTRGREIAFGTSRITLVRTPRSHAKFWSLGDFRAQQLEARRLVETQLAPVFGALTR